VADCFAEELATVLPGDLPHRETVVAKAARHLDLIVEANQHFNLTRITTPHEAAVKHVLDSVYAWRFFSAAKHVMDAGSGAGFPGIPLALVLPEVRFTLAESIHKRARFLEAVVDALDLPNVDVVPERAETVLRQRYTIRIITARAVAPISRLIPLFAPAFKNGARALFFKGPDVESEMHEALGEARRLKLRMRIVEHYELPGHMGCRNIVELSSGVK
jgi:16S rRNA (guanine527-N7)-methyltransferase